MGGGAQVDREEGEVDREGEATGEGEGGGGRGFGAKLLSTQPRPSH